MGTANPHHRWLELGNRNDAPLALDEWDAEAWQRPRTLAPEEGRKL